MTKSLSDGASPLSTSRHSLSGVYLSTLGWDLGSIEPNVILLSLPPESFSFGTCTVLHEVVDVSSGFL